MYDCAFWILPPTTYKTFVMFLSVQTLAELFFSCGPSCCNFFWPGHITTSEYIQPSAYTIDLDHYSRIASLPLFLSLAPFPFTESTCPILSFPALAVLYLPLLHLSILLLCHASLPVSFLPLLAPVCFPTWCFHGSILSSPETLLWYLQYPWYLQLHFGLLVFQVAP